MALNPADDAARGPSPAAILYRCQRLTDHIANSIERAKEKPSYGAWANVQRLKAKRRQLQAEIRPSLATVDGEVVNQ